MEEWSLDDFDDSNIRWMRWDANHPSLPRPGAAEQRSQAVVAKWLETQTPPPPQPLAPQSASSSNRDDCLCVQVRDICLHSHQDYYPTAAWAENIPSSRPLFRRACSLPPDEYYSGTTSLLPPPWDPDAFETESCPDFVSAEYDTWMDEGAGGESLPGGS
jgi:hypothetical protein